MAHNLDRFEFLPEEVYFLLSPKKVGIYPAMSTIAEELNLSRRNIQRAVADLEKAGFMKTEQRFRRKGGKSSLLYTILK